ncbi:helix-turn-helix domain-containing protein [Nocardia sp. NBC_00416]|uniref:helix-turn-helix domain-containing protein n=1 Tax=Nocardia sp. NBC_00416 TaxID=2975991 RepID=UPI003FA6130E
MIEDGPVGRQLREWRHPRKLSQLEPAIQAEVSPRHISFVATGRTVPSSAMVLRPAEHLDVPLRERNRLPVAADHPSLDPADAATSQFFQAGTDPRCVAGSVRRGGRSAR